MKMVKYGEIGSKKFGYEDIPDNLKSEADSLREELVEKIAESDEQLMDKYFEEGTLSNEDLTEGIKKAILNGNLIPVFAVSATKGVGIDNFLDFVSDYFPSPSDRTNIKGSLKGSNQEVEVICDPQGEASCLIFKSLSEQHVGELSIFKIYSGTLTPGLDLNNKL
jgi:elongation factor G